MGEGVVKFNDAGWPSGGGEAETIPETQVKMK
jgi:hypothetical protein